MNLLPKSKLIRYFLLALLFLLLCVLGLIGYLYIQGGQKNYIPPKVEVNTNEEQLTADLLSISHAIESYYTINLSYPPALKDLVPEFINKIPSEPQTNSDYIYKVFADSAYEITIINPQNYNLKEIKVRNGKFVKN